MSVCPSIFVFSRSSSQLRALTPVRNVGLAPCEPKRLELQIERVPREHFECPRCKALFGVHDTIERRWRHLNFFQYRCELVARAPRSSSGAAPWTREGSGFSLLTEALDMSPADVKGATDHFPQARIAFDKFHLTRLFAGIGMASWPTSTPT